MFAIQKEDLGYADIGDGTTFGGIQSRGDLPFSIYGDTWLKSVYAIFDVVSVPFCIPDEVYANVGLGWKPLRRCPTD